MKEAIIILLIFTNYLLFAQKINVKNISGKPVEKASVIVLVKYRATDYILNNAKEKLISVITDSTGIVQLKGEFQKDNSEVESITVEIKHADYSDLNITTQDYSKDPKFNYSFYLTPKNKDVNITGMPGTNERNELDIYSAADIARKMNTKEEEIISLIENGKLKGKRIGSKYFVSGSELRKFLTE